MLDVLGCRVHFRESGTGEPVLLLHGNPDSSLLWEPVAAHLSKRFRCIAPDLPGYGQSTAPTNFDYTLAGQAHFLSALVRGLGLTNPISVIGHDFGAIFAMAWLTRHPEMVRSAVISNSAFFPDYQWHIWARAWRCRRVGEVMMALMSLRGIQFVYRAGFPPVPPSYIEQAYSLITPTVKRNILRLYRSVPPSAFASWESEYLRATERVPVLALWADGDPFIPIHFADRFAARRVVHFRRSGHWLPLAEPEAFARVAAEFLSAT